MQSVDYLPLMLNHPLWVSKFKKHGCFILNVIFAIIVYFIKIAAKIRQNP